MIQVARTSRGPLHVGDFPMAHAPAEHQRAIAEHGFTLAYAQWQGDEITRVTELVRAKWDRAWRCPLHDVYRLRLASHAHRPVWRAWLVCDGCHPKTR